MYPTWFDELCEAVEHTRATREPCLAGWTDEAGQKFPKWAVVTCPCGHAEPTSLNVMPGSPHHWDIEIHDDGTFSISPSIKRVSDRYGYPCDCHFYWLQGKVA